MSELTAKTLIHLIRTATSLTELQHIVGASDEEQTQAERRMGELDRLWNAYYAKDLPIPESVKRRYDKLDREQAEFEARYC